MLVQLIEKLNRCGNYLLREDGHRAGRHEIRIFFMQNRRHSLRNYTLFAHVDIYEAFVLDHVLLSRIYAILVSGIGWTRSRYFMQARTPALMLNSYKQNPVA